uniref:Uncharacterized protein n=1 Tax=Sphaerodactylus townsendi TaxID=933632 RepID=A0ACB8FCU2_9SAUR
MGLLEVTLQEQFFVSHYPGPIRVMGQEKEVQPSSQVLNLEKTWHNMFERVLTSRLLPHNLQDSKPYLPTILPQLAQTLLFLCLNNSLSPSHIHCFLRLLLFMLLLCPISFRDSVLQTATTLLFHSLYHVSSPDFMYTLRVSFSSLPLACRFHRHCFQEFMPLSSISQLPMSWDSSWALSYPRL